MRLADILDRYKISNELELRPDRLSDFGVTCPLVPKKSHIRPCPECSLLSSDCNLIKLADNLDRHELSDEFDFRTDQTIGFGVTCL